MAIPKQPFECAFATIMEGSVDSVKQALLDNPQYTSHFLLLEPIHNQELEPLKPPETKFNSNLVPSQEEEMASLGESEAVMIRQCWTTEKQIQDGKLLVSKPFNADLSALVKTHMPKIRDEFVSKSDEFSSLRTAEEQPTDLGEICSATRQKDSPSLEPGHATDMEVLRFVYSLKVMTSNCKSLKESPVTSLEITSEIDSELEEIMAKLATLKTTKDFQRCESVASLQLLQRQEESGSSDYDRDEQNIKEGIKASKTEEERLLSQSLAKAAQVVNSCKEFANVISQSNKEARKRAQLEDQLSKVEDLRRQDEKKWEHNMIAQKKISRYRENESKVCTNFIVLIEGVKGTIDSQIFLKVDTLEKQKMVAGDLVSDLWNVNLAFSLRMDEYYIKTGERTKKRRDEISQQMQDLRQGRRSCDNPNYERELVQLSELKIELDKQDIKINSDLDLYTENFERISVLGNFLKDNPCIIREGKLSEVPLTVLINTKPEYKTIKNKSDWDVFTEKFERIRALRNFLKDNPCIIREGKLSKVPFKVLTNTKPEDKTIKDIFCSPGEQDGLWWFDMVLNRRHAIAEELGQYKMFLRKDVYENPESFPRTPQRGMLLTDYDGQSTCSAADGALVCSYVPPQLFEHKQFCREVEVCSSDEAWKDEKTRVEMRGQEAMHSLSGNSSSMTVSKLDIAVEMQQDVADLLFKSRKSRGKKQHPEP